MLVAGLQALHALALGFTVNPALSFPLDLLRRQTLLHATALALVPVGLGIAVGLWLLQRWAWVATMLWVGFTMVGALLAYFRGTPEYSLMLLSVAVVFYLNLSDVQQAFRRHARTEAPR